MKSIGVTEALVLVVVLVSAGLAMLPILAALRPDAAAAITGLGTVYGGVLAVTIRALMSKRENGNGDRDA